MFLRRCWTLEKFLSSPYKSHNKSLAQPSSHPQNEQSFALSGGLYIMVYTLRYTASHYMYTCSPVCSEEVSVTFDLQQILLETSLIQAGRKPAFPATLAGGRYLNTAKKIERIGSWLSWSTSPGLRTILPKQRPNLDATFNLQALPRYLLSHHTEGTSKPYLFHSQ